MITFRDETCAVCTWKTYCIAEATIKKQNMEGRHLLWHWGKAFAMTLLPV